MIVLPPTVAVIRLASAAAPAEVTVLRRPAVTTLVPVAALALRVLLPFAPLALSAFAPFAALAFRVFAPVVALTTLPNWPVMVLPPAAALMKLASIATLLVATKLFCPSVAVMTLFCTAVTVLLVAAVMVLPPADALSKLAFAAVPAD